jgi:hypothetical protein
LQSNGGISGRDLQLIGSGFLVSPEEAQQLGLGTVNGLERQICPYRNGCDLAGSSRLVMVIELFGLEADEVRRQFPAAYQHVLEHVKPERAQNNRASYRNKWWVHGEPRSSFRAALAGLSRYIATVETAKHRTFLFLDACVAPDNMLVCIALAEAQFLGVLSSCVHVTSSLAAGGRLGVGNDPRYNKSRCFEPFPFPDLDRADRFGGPLCFAVVDADGQAGPSQTFGEYPSERVRALAEQLDAHRKRQQAAHPAITLTGNVQRAGQIAQR